MPLPNNTSDPFPQVDSSHGGPSRDVIAVYLRQLRDGYIKLEEKLGTHKDLTAKSFEEIRLHLARLPSACPKADQCTVMWEEVEALKFDKAKSDGKVEGGKIVLTAISAAIGSLVTMAGIYFTAKGK
jgi:hypothetical protein